MPLGTLMMSSNDIHIGKYYNALTHMNFNEKLETEIKRIMGELEIIVRYVCENHMIYAVNCGENYIPCEQGKSKPSSLVMIIHSHKSRLILFSQFLKE